MDKLTGYYYAINNSGENTYDFIFTPSKSQAKYRRNKYGDRIVFVDFKTWETHIINEDELKI